MKSKTLRLHDVVADNDTRRLNHFAGRYLSEQEFDLMQRYVDERCEDLLRTAPPGIVSGLELSINENGGNLDITVQPGLAVGGDGKAVQVQFPIHLQWPSLLEEYKNRITPPGYPQPPLQGFYFLTVKRQVALVDDSPAAEPCSRRDPDPLRDSRLETFATLDLHFISRIPSWMAMNQTRAAMRILVEFLNESAFDPQTGAVPLALLKIENDTLQWADSNAGRFLSQADTVYRNLLNYWQLLQRQINPPFDPTLSLAQNLGVDYLPAAGPLPQGLITDISGRQIEVAGQQQWQRPVAHFNPYDLQIELLPVAANTVAGVIEYELNRGVVDLVHAQQDRLRVMVAVEPDTWRADLMDLPAIDIPLLHEAYVRYVTAASDYNAWAEQFFEVYGNLDRDAAFNGDIPNLETRRLFNSVYKVTGPVGDFSVIATAAQRKQLGIPVAQPAPQSVQDFLAQLVDTREGSLADGEALPRPYSQTPPAPPADLEDVAPPFPGEIGAGLYRRQADLKASIERQHELIDSNSDLLNELGDFLGSQRQHLDSITVSFASLAGGVAGDGSGLNLIRWSDSLAYTPPTQASTEPPG